MRLGQFQSFRRRPTAAVNAAVTEGAGGASGHLLENHLGLGNKSKQSIAKIKGPLGAALEDWRSQSGLIRFMTHQRDQFVIIPTNGWALATKAALRARLGDGNYAWLLVRKVLEPAFGTDLRADGGGGGAYANQFDVSPPFQIDGNFGVTAAIAEMLLQSQEGVIQLLPAMPDVWKEGKVSELRARGGFMINITWKKGKLISANIYSKDGKPCKIKYGSKTCKLNIDKGRNQQLNRILDE